MLRFIEHVRTKPKAVRNQYAFFGAAIITLCIVLVWAVSLPARFASFDAEEKETTGAFSQFFNDAKSNLGVVFQAVQEPEDTTVATATEEVSNVVIPDLSEETIEEVNAPEPREILIGTTSRETASSSEDG